jgi:hypothetical protein
MSERFEMRVSAELLAKIDEARGPLPRATWVKRVVEAALEPAKLPEPRPPVQARAVPGQWNRVTRLGPGS